jgi:hypothetical protein
MARSCFLLCDAASRFARAATSKMLLAAAAVKHTAHNLRTPKHEGLYRYGRRCGRHNPLLHRPLIGGMGGGAASPSRVNRYYTDRAAARSGSRRGGAHARAPRWRLPP